MEDNLDYIAESIIRAGKRTISILGLVSIVLLYFVEHWILKVGGHDITFISEIIIAYVGVFVILFIWELRAAFPSVKLRPVIEEDLQYSQIKRAFLVFESD